VAEPPLTFASLLRRLRVEAGLTQEELAEAARLGPRTVSDLERGIAATPQRSTRQRLADALNLTGPARAQFEAVARGRAFDTDDQAADSDGAMRTLPRDVASFTGRQREFQQVVETALGLAEAGGVVGICAIGGMAGVGKTAFALHAAHRLAPQYPAGQIFLPLYGHTPGRRPVDPSDALASLLLTTGIPAAQIPPGLEARMSLWRGRLAERQLLLVLDDAISSEQVEPLLPGAGGSLVLVTSRRRLSALDDSTTISLDILPPEEAAGLLLRLVARPELTPADPELRQLAELCGYLPLALGLVGRRLHQHPAWSLTEQIAELAEARNRLELMKTENLSVAAAFDLSYQELPDEQRRVFRQLGLHPGNDFDAYAVAALNGCDLETARDHLEALYDQYLLIELAHGRYQFHDLIRHHARTLANRLDPRADRDQAQGRLLDYYQHTAALAEARLARQTNATAPWSPAVPLTAARDFEDSDQALAWVRAERPNLLACLDHVTRLRDDARVVILTAGLAGLWRQDGPWTDAVDRHTVAVTAAQRLGDQAGLAGAMINLGIIQWLTDDPATATQTLQQALNIYSELGNQLGRANALNCLGHGRQMLDDRPAAAQAQLDALDIYRTLGDRLGQANALSSLAVVRRQTGDFVEAVDALEQSLDIYRGLGDRLGLVSALNNLAIVLWQSTDYPRAAAALEEALEISRVLGDRQGQANGLTNLGAVRRQTGDYLEAAEALQEGLRIFRDLGSRLGQASALVYLGTVWRQTEDYPAAAQAMEEALGIFRDVGDRGGHSTALLYLGTVRRRTGDYAAAAEAVAEALGILRDIGDRGGEVEALNESGTIDLARGELDQAEAFHHKALDLARAIDSPWDEAHALAGLGRCALAAGRTADAIDGVRQAHEIFQRIGAAEASELAVELAALTAEGPVG
jgi:tetratricopeptide (TPR) repeat protein/transcriptional regulator with XRE-family HTH domain